MTPKQSPEQRTSLRIAADDAALFIHASLMVSVYCPDSITEADALVESDQSLLFDYGVSVVRGIVNLKETHTEVLVKSFTEECRDINKGASVAFLKEIRDSQ